MLQAGRIVNVHLPKDRVTQTHQGFGFVEFSSEEDADYAAKTMNQVRLWTKPIRVNKASADKQKTLEVGAELFIGNLDPMVDEHVLLDTFGRFGNLTSAPKISRDENNLSKGFGFVGFSAFEASDDAIANMHGQYLMNKEITVQYAYKKDGKGDRHGDAAERAIAASGRANNIEQPSMQSFQPPVAASSAQYANQGMSNGQQGYNGVPPPQQQRQQMQPPPGNMGLPPRPSSSSAGGYGGGPPGYGAPAPGFAPPPGYGAPPGMQAGFGAMPPGMSPAGYGQQRR